METIKGTEDYQAECSRNQFLLWNHWWKEDEVDVAR